MKKPCWVAAETASGWRLRLDVGGKHYTVKGFLFKNLKEMWHLVSGLTVVWMKENKKRCKSDGELYKATAE